MKRAFVFPGQGSQFVGMGQDLAAAFPEAREVFEAVDDALRQNLSRLLFEGPEADLNLTENAQPALMAVSLAVARVLTQQGGLDFAKDCAYVAGHSLGEYSALTVADSLDLEEAARLLRLRGQAMQAAVPVGVGAMAAILGLNYDDVEAMAAEVSGEEVCVAANDNSVGQVVVSGHKAAVEAVVALATERGAKKAVTLPVSVPAHSSLMAPAAEKMEEALAVIDIRPPVVPVVANVTAQAVSDPGDIRRLLVEQVTGAVRWRESVLWMKAQGVGEMIELGAGKVLSGLIRRIDKEIETFSAGTPEQVEDLIKKLEG